MNMFFSRALLLISSLLSLRIATAQNSDDLLASLQASLSAQAVVITPDDAGFQNASSRWSLGPSPTFIAVVEVAQARDVQVAVQFANNHSLPFLAVNSRHALTSTLASFTNGLGISLSKLDNISLNADDTVSAGPAVTSGDLLRFLHAQGRRTTTTATLCIKIASPILGGGFGLLQGQHGFMTDQLISADVVLADGSAVTVSEDEHAELFWALRGAGHNFGIVTGMKLKTYEDPSGQEGWTYVTLTFSGDVLEKVFEAVDEVIKGKPGGLVVYTYFEWNPVWDAENAILFIQVFYEGSAAALEGLIAPLRGMNALNNTSTTTDYVTLHRVAGLDESGFPCLNLQKTYHLQLPVQGHTFNATAERAAYDCFNAATKANADLQLNSVVIHEAYGLEGPLMTPDKESAIAFRQYNTLSAPIIGFANDSSRDAATALGEELRAILLEGTGSIELHAYVNYAYGDETPKALYGYEPWRLQKLRGLKSIYDLEDKFRFYGPVE